MLKYGNPNHAHKLQFQAKDTASFFSLFLATPSSLMSSCLRHGLLVQARDIESYFQLAPGDSSEDAANICDEYWKIQKVCKELETEQVIEALAQDVIHSPSALVGDIQTCNSLEMTYLYLDVSIHDASAFQLLNSTLCKRLSEFRKQEGLLGDFIGRSSLPTFLLVFDHYSTLG